MPLRTMLQRAVPAGAVVLGIALATATATAAAAPRPVTADPVPGGPVYTALGWISPWVSAASAEDAPRPGVLGTVANLDLPDRMLELADGSLLVTSGTDRIYRVKRDGRIEYFAGPAGSDPAKRPVTRASFDWISDLAQLPDGSVLVAEEFGDLVRRIGTDGRIHTVAGTRKRTGSGGVSGFSGDGGPARRAKLSEPVGLAVLPDGSFLIADGGNNRVRRVARNGTITTVAGTGRGRASGDGGAATRAGIAGPVALAVQPDGGFLIAEGGGLDALNLTHGAGGVRRVAPNGTISTVARMQVRSLVATSDGGFLAAPGWNLDQSADRIVRVDARGHRRVVAGRRDHPNGAWAKFRPSLLNGISPLAAHVETEYLAPARDGGVLFNDLVRIRYWAPARPRRLAVAVEPATLTSPLALRAHVRLSRPARVVAQVWRDGRVVRRASRRLPAGQQTIALGDRVAPGRYVLRVTASARGSVPRRVSDAVVVFPGGRLPLDAARSELTRFLRRGAVFPFAGPSRAAVITSCERLSRTRARCAIERPKKQCSVSVDVVLRRDGSVVLAAFRGPLRCST